MARVRFSKLSAEDRTPFDGLQVFSPTHESGVAEVTRDQARAIAEGHLAHLATQGRPTGATGVREVLRLEELRFRAPVIWGFPEDRLRSCWIAYLERPVRGLFSSTVILVHGQTGEVLFCGSANDEG